MNDDKEMQWKAATEIFASERHFNEMQNHCRTLASTWLLAAFAGVGYILKEKSLSDVALAAALVSIAAAVGVFMLWIVDVKVWHRLLLANGLAGHRLEIENPWMPRVRENISASKGWFPVRVHLSFFYGFGIAVLVAMATFFMTRATAVEYATLIAVSIAAAGGFTVTAMVASAYLSNVRDKLTLKRLRADADLKATVHSPQSPDAG